jgi:SSS family solute:Na+ symporter
MGRLGLLDSGVVIAYFLGITLFGALLGRFTRSTRDFFLAGQRFPAWLVAFSCVATVVGSYSFIKYSAAGYQYGVASSQTYLNDWFWMPLFLFGWYPILYYSRILSVPEYFKKRFDRRAGLAATFVLLLYLVGYIGINLFTLGTALQSLLGIDVFVMAALVTALCMVYEWTGGQTSVIFTDFMQGSLLLLAGLLVAVLGLTYLGGLQAFAEALPDGHLRPLAGFNDRSAFNFVGIFWQDGLAGGVAFYFMNQGMLMRFLSARSVGTGRRAAAGVLLVLMPLAAIAVSGAGWIGAAMAGRGDLAASTRADEIFVVVTKLLCAPGVFGIVMAALLAALMSTADTLINATSALMVNDVYRPLIVPGRDERHYLRAARWTSLLAAVAGLSLVPLYGSFDTIYEAHGAFTAAITPPMAVALLLAFLWPRFTPAAALATLLGGTGLMFLSLKFPGLVAPFAHGIPPDGGYKYIRACYGVAVSGAIGFGVTWLTRPRPSSEITGLTLWSLAAGRKRYLGRDIPWRKRERIRARAVSIAVGDAPVSTPALGPGESPIVLDRSTMKRLGVVEGDPVFVDDARWWWGGLRSSRARVAAATGTGEKTERTRVRLPARVMETNRWRNGQPVVLEVIE